MGMGRYRFGLTAALLLACTALTSPSLAQDHAGRFGASSTTTTTTETVKLSSTELLTSIKRSSALIVVHYKKAKTARKLSKGEIVLTDAASFLITKVTELEQAIKKKKAKGVSTAMRRMFVAYGQLLSSYQLVETSDTSVTVAIRAITAAWTPYSAYFATGKGAQGAAPSKSAFSKTKAIYASHSKRLATCHKKVAKNKRLARQVARMQRMVSRYERGINAGNYRAALAQLAVISGYYDSTRLIAEAYYVDLVDVFAADMAAFDQYDVVWGDYYDVFYDGMDISEWSAEFDVNEEAVLDDTEVDAEEFADSEDIDAAIADATDISGEFDKAEADDLPEDVPLEDAAAPDEDEPGVVTEDEPEAQVEATEPDPNQPDAGQPNDPNQPGDQGQPDANPQDDPNQPGGNQFDPNQQQDQQQDQQPDPQQDPQQDQQQQDQQNFQPEPQPDPEPEPQQQDNGGGGGYDGGGGGGPPDDGGGGGFDPGGGGGGDPGGGGPF